MTPPRLHHVWHTVEVRLGVITPVGDTLMMTRTLWTNGICRDRVPIRTASYVRSLSRWRRRGQTTLKTLKVLTIRLLIIRTFSLRWRRFYSWWCVGCRLPGHKDRELCSICLSYDWVNEFPQTRHNVVVVRKPERLVELDIERRPRRHRERRC